MLYIVQDLMTFKFCVSLKDVNKISANYSDIKWPSLTVDIVKFQFDPKGQILLYIAASIS